MQRWSFHSQVFFLGKRLEHHRQLLDHPTSVIQDRTVYEDAEIFARNLFEQGSMSDRDYDAYCRLYQAIRAFVPPPDLIVYLQASVDMLLARIAQRGRDFERGISRSYLTQLNLFYQEWIDQWTACPVLQVAADGTDWQHNSDDLVRLVQNVQAALIMNNR
jgi:deoxyadenosine/deoxycytidine kinase